MLVYTSITKSYLPKARVLAKSVKKYHPSWTFVLLFSDELPNGFDVKNEPFDEVLTIQELGIPNWKSWAFGHALVELCTAVKGPAAEYLAKRPSVSKIMYLDPDIKVFGSLSILEDLLDEHDILLTPHLLDPELEINAIKDNEISTLKHGIYNLGFFAATTSGQGLNFIRWWADRLTKFCRDDIPAGLFTDQRWCDLAPAFFSKLHIIRDRGCNVATWNIAQRPFSRDSSGRIMAGGAPLLFYHFTSYDNGNGMGMLQKYASSQDLAREVWEGYGQDLSKEGHRSPSHDLSWHFSKYENGEPIPNEARRAYRDRIDLHQAFPDPYSVLEPSFYGWWIENCSKVSAGGIVPFSEMKGLRRRLSQFFKSPRESLKMVKNAVKVIKREGFRGFISKI